MSRFVFGVDIGGTTVKLGLFDTEGNLNDKWEIPTRTENAGENILPDIAKSILDLMNKKNISKEDVEGIGIGAPGPVDESGVIHKAANLGWGEFSIKDTLEKITGLKVMAGNDANVAALGEMWKGGAAGCKDIVMVTLGTGVGGGIIVNGRILSGYLGAGGEIGHIHVNDDEEECCGCGKKGCLEQYSSATGITRMGKKVLSSCDDPSALREGDVNAKTIFDAVKAGDKVADRIADIYGHYLGEALANIACVVNPEVILLGGGVSKAGQVVIDYVKPYFDRRVFHGSSQTRFALATLGNDAGIYGAARLVLS
ncbi:MAG: ROK family glucokinase [Lachnospiraceae bacterium]|nr:ROK family glucokinase [Lachnospiraceae bacterium]